MIGQAAPIDPIQELADQLRRLRSRIDELERAASVSREQSGRASGTTDSSGELSVTFPEPFATAPVVTVTAQTSTDRFAVLREATATGFTVAYYDLSIGAVAASTPIGVHWRATT